MALGAGGTIHERTNTSLSSRPGEGLCLQTYDLQYESPDLLQRAGSVTAVVSEKWMDRFVIKQKVMCSDASSIASVQNQIPTVVCVQIVVSEKWMDRFVFGLVECLSASGTSAVGRTFGPAVSEEYSPVVFAGGGGGRLSMHTPWSS